ncbi:MAG TPA: hypothetical protein VN729_08235 [Ktedonobacteraceae bacterium]|nr:hypothetical protein [Ktedonobacteraceae bacterium]
MQGTRTDHGLGAIRDAQFRQEMLDMELQWIFPRFRRTVLQHVSAILPVAPDFFRGYNGK